MNTQLFNIHFFVLLSAWLCSSPPSQILACHEDKLKFGPCPCDGGWATGSQVQVQIKVVAHCVFNRNCRSCHKKSFKWSQIWHPKPQKIFTSILLATATNLKRQEQNHLLISWMCCENKFLQATFFQEKDKFFSASQSKFVTSLQKHFPVLTPSKPSGFPSQRHLLHSSYFPQAMKQCPIKRVLHRSADVAALVQCSSLFCRAAVDAQPLCQSLQPPHSVRGSLDNDGLIQQGQQNSAAILYMYSVNTASIQNFFNSLCKSKLRRKGTVCQHRASQPTLTGHLTSSPRLSAPLCSPSKMPSLCHTGDGFSCCLPTIT